MQQLLKYYRYSTASVQFDSFTPLVKEVALRATALLIGQPPRCDLLFQFEGIVKLPLSYVNSTEILRDICLSCRSHVHSQGRDYARLANHWWA